MHLISWWDRCFFVPETRKEYQMNRVIIIGRVNKGGVNFNDNFEEDPKCRFKLAVKERWQDNELTELVNIFATSIDAKKMTSSRVGDFVFVKGLANNGKYEKEGETIYYYEIESKSLRIIKENGDLRKEGLYQNDITLIGHPGSDPKVFDDGKKKSASYLVNQ
jgi:hypothetical protein